jgi:hypothetical protein
MLCRRLRQRHTLEDSSRSVSRSRDVSAIVVLLLLCISSITSLPKVLLNSVVNNYVSRSLLTNSANCSLYLLARFKKTDRKTYIIALKVVLLRYLVNLVILYLRQSRVLNLALKNSIVINKALTVK